MSRQLKSLLYFTLVGLLVISCHKQEPEQVTVKPSEDKALLTSMEFNTKMNPQMVSKSSCTKGNGYVYASVPDYVDITKLVPTMAISENASVELNGVKYDEGQPFDFSEPVKLKVVSGTGKNTSEYTVLVKYGDKDIDKKAYEFMVKYSIPGVSISVMKDEKIVYASGYGLADVEHNVKVTPDHLFRLASISKTFTAVCIMKLIEDGKLSLDSHVFGADRVLDSVFPGVTGMETEVTVRNLLHHNSGFKTSPDPVFDYDSSIGTDEIIRRRALGCMVEKPGTKYSYSNIGFLILGRVVEVVSGKDYESFLKEDVLAPAGITDIHVGGNKQQRRPNECIYYSQSGTNGYGNNMPVIKALGGLIASSNQLMDWLAHIDGKTEVPDILKPETLDIMYHTVASTNKQRALGWSVNHSVLFPGGHFHSGNLSGTATYYVGGTTEGMSAAVLCNSRSYISGFDTDTVLLTNDFTEYFKKLY